MDEESELELKYMEDIVDDGSVRLDGEIIDESSLVPTDDDLNCLPSSFMSSFGTEHPVKDDFSDELGLPAPPSVDPATAASDQGLLDAASTETDEQLAATGGSSAKKLRGPRSKKTAKSIATLNELSRDTKTTVRKWERKPVQIKTLEGEFTVMVWTTGWNVFSLSLFVTLLK